MEIVFLLTFMFQVDILSKTITTVYDLHVNTSCPGILAQTISVILNCEDRPDEVYLGPCPLIGEVSYNVILSTNCSIITIGNDGAAIVTVNLTLFILNECHYHVELILDTVNISGISLVSSLFNFSKYILLIHNTLYI